MDGITYPCYEKSLLMLAKGVPVFFAQCSPVTTHIFPKTTYNRNAKAGQSVRSMTGSSLPTTNRLKVSRPRLIMSDIALNW